MATDSLTTKPTTTDPTTTDPTTTEPTTMEPTTRELTTTDSMTKEPKTMPPFHVSYLCLLFRLADLSSLVRVLYLVLNLLVVLFPGDH